MDNINPIRPTLVTNYRSDDEIRHALQQIRDRPTSPDKPTRRHVLAILDDLGEEMIGRSNATDPDLESQIREQRARWGAPATPVTDVPTT